MEISSEIALARVDVFAVDSIADLASGEVGGVTDAAWGSSGSHGVLVFATGRVVVVDPTGLVTATLLTGEVLRCAPRCHSHAYTCAHVASSPTAGPTLTLTPPPSRPTCVARCVAVDPTGQCVFTGGSAGVVKVWDCRTDAPAADASAGEDVAGVELDAAAALVKGLSPVADAKSPPAPSDGSQAITALRLSPDCATMAVGTSAGSLFVMERPRGV